MKNFLKSTFYVAVFVISGVVFQISCSNSEESALVNPVDKLVFTQVDSTGQTIWTCNGDGSNLVQIPISLPPNWQLNFTNGLASPRLSPDGQTIYFVVNDLSGAIVRGLICSCNIDGSNVQQVANPATDATLDLGSIN